MEPATSVTQKTVITRTAETEACYLKTFRSLEKQFRRAVGMGSGEDFDPVRFAAWFTASHPWAKATWRLYKAAAMYRMSLLETPDAREAEQMIVHTAQTKFLKAGVKTSGLKKKSVSEKEAQVLDKLLSGSNSKWSGMLRIWLRINQLVGLRPCEWWQAHIIALGNGDLALRAKNAKNTNGRAHGLTRTIPLLHLSANDMELLYTHLNTVSQHDFAEAYPACRNLLYWANNKAWPTRRRRITLYSTRHQFFANAKASGRTPEEIGALGGHSSGDTNQIHYGKKQFGIEIPGITALPEEVAKVSKAKRQPPKTKAIPDDRKIYR